MAKIIRRIWTSQRLTVPRPAIRVKLTQPT
jgi:hypothetical protein